MRLLAITFILLLLTACGQKGPLYLPEEPVAPPVEGDEPQASTTASSPRHPVK